LLEEACRTSLGMEGGRSWFRVCGSVVDVVGRSLVVRLKVGKVG
jgi:hypothetical protein